MQLVERFGYGTAGVGSSLTASLQGLGNIRYRGFLYAVGRALWVRHCRRRFESDC